MREAKVHYGDAGIRLITAGDYVVCAVTGVHIKLDDLRYWSVERQEAYVDAAASLARHQAVKNEGKT